MATGGAVGLGAAFLQMLEKIQLLKHMDKALACDLNSVFSCSNVLNAWQSSVFGFPNSLMCMVFFTVFVVAGLAGLAAGSVPLPRAFRLGVHALALFVLGFALWFLWQSIYVIGSLCILCIFCFSGLLLVNWAWLRANADILPGARLRAHVARLIRSGADTFAWLLLAALVAFAMLLRFS
ncbi:MAG TPA: vitamin K epoxide reductase family protein [Candidatus Saccharimonadales bacterium]|nr:vitamin K epoxide reductase family protein [Candidatus Saccharimonadales bacterium]